tara:strand:+ start:407 stop:1087 length:681 start_codon:yes stop_codon:yes gene_type:complete
MNWQCKGYLLSKIKYNENSIISEFYTENHGKVSGIIFGGSSKKIKNYLFEGNKLHINYSSKSQTKIGSLKVEIDEFYTPYYLENKKKLLCIIYAMNLIKLLTVENEKNIEIFQLIDEFFKILTNKNWLSQFIIWELKFYKLIGYDINFKEYVDEIINNNTVSYIMKNSKKLIPNFLVEKKIDDINDKDNLLAFSIVGDYLDKTIIKSNNLNFPRTRTDFYNSLKSI